MVDAAAEGLFLAGALVMMDDHSLLSEARQHLADALRPLLQTGIMGEADFTLAREHARLALCSLDDLLRKSHRHTP